jgi:hypothetical protein
MGRVLGVSVADPRGYVDALARILGDREPGPAQQAILQSGGFLEPHNAGDFRPERVDFVHYHREGTDDPEGEKVRYRVYVNATGDATPELIAGMPVGLWSG